MGLFFRGDPLPDFEDDFFYQPGLDIEDLRLVNVGREEDDELSGCEPDVADLILRDCVESNVPLFIVGCGRDGGFQRGVAKSFGAGEDDLNIGIIPMAFGIAFFSRLGGIFIDDGKDVVAIDVMPSCLQGCQVGGQGKVDGPGKIGTDSFIPEKLRERRCDHGKLICTNIICIDQCFKYTFFIRPFIKLPAQ